MLSPPHGKSVDPDRKRRRRKGIKVIFIVLGLLVLAYCFICVKAADSFLRPIRFRIERPFGLIDLTVPTRYGDDPAWATPDWHESPVVFILAHGYHGSRKEFSALLEAMMKRGYGAIALSMNGQDQSPDKMVGFGPKEAKTILDTVNFVRKQRQDRPRIILFGISMGGAASWLASEEDRSVDAVVTEGSFADFPSAMDTWMSRFPVPKFMLFPAVWLARMKSGLNPELIRPVDAAKKWKGRPALVVQAGDDELMPLRHAQELSAASGATLWVVPGAKHAKCSQVDLPGYMEHIDKLVRTVESDDLLP